MGEDKTNTIKDLDSDRMGAMFADNQPQRNFTYSLSPDIHRTLPVKHNPLSLEEESPFHNNKNFQGVNEGIDIFDTNEQFKGNFINQ